MLDASGEHIGAIVCVPVGSGNSTTALGCFVIPCPFLFCYLEIDDPGRLKHLTPGAPPVPASPCPGLQVEVTAF